MARRAALEEIDPWWCPRWPITWQRSYAVARQWWLESDGRVDWAQLPAETEFEGEALGRWVRAQRAGWAEFDQEQQDLLTASADRFAHHLAALAAFVERESHARVPRTHKTEEGLSLGTWLNNQKARRDKLCGCR
ncbi:helicase associated domain-containing protein (plasmid) [Streptomyces viridifaciens]|uniref:helicase associated domain-containing protein n=1 Tax=Kitasatospora aureofaciens TaxID=1894 RepID=UPI000926CC02|nr:helicase associated domain-containing protein [Streptomyces viridifaciens]